MKLDFPCVRVDSQNLFYSRTEKESTEVRTTLRHVILGSSEQKGG